ncbi:glycosyltransferase [bacterium]|nr:glycosyltransferase [bacterium]
MNVLHSRAIWLGLTETWIYNQVRYLPPDVTSHVLCDRLENRGQFAWPHLHMTASNQAQYSLLKASRRYDAARRALFDRLVHDHDISVTHSHFGPEGWRNHRLVQRHGLAHVITFYGYDIGQKPRNEPEWSDRYREMFDAVDAVLCEGPFMAQTVVETLGCPPQKAVSIASA